jgi:hypothetical protein
MKKFYAERDIIKQGEYYGRHVSAMTGEGLHEKCDIAAELAHRDIEIDRLKDEIAQWRLACREHEYGISDTHVRLLEEENAALRTELEKLTNKLNENSQNFQIECQKEEIGLLRAQVATLKADKERLEGEE